MMSTIDKLISIISPEWAAKREIARQTLRAIKNTGYSSSGASTYKRSMKGWQAWSSSPQADIDMNLDTLRQRSRDLFMNSGLARSAITTPRTNVIGAGLKLKARIDYEALGISIDEADEWEKKTEREFALWADSLFCDATCMNNFYEIQSLVFMSSLLNGDGWALIKFEDPKPYFPYSLRIHAIEGDRVSTPIANTDVVSYTYGPIGFNSESGNRVINGVEIDKTGKVVAYWVSSAYPNDPANPTAMWEWTRVEAFGKRTGIPNILQVMVPERCEQYRGVPFLSPVIEDLKQIKRYTEAELMAAIVMGFFTIFIKEGGGAIGDFPLAEAVGAKEKISIDPADFELGAGTINTLPPGYDIAAADPKRPSSNFESFTTALAKHVGAALEIPYELLLKNFTASYSASRAALLEAWKAFRMRRTWFANDFCQPIYEVWLREAVSIGRIDAPGFFNDPIAAKAWARAEWHGPAPGQVDPVKEVQAAQMRVQNGFSTRERESIELIGSDFDRNIDQLQREVERMKAAGIPTQPQQGM